jgi:hypothetical protein
MQQATVPINSHSPIVYCVVVWFFKSIEAMEVKRILLFLVPLLCVSGKITKHGTESFDQSVDLVATVILDSKLNLFHLINLLAPFI